MADPRASRRSIRVQREDGAVLTDPPLRDVTAVIEGNRRLLEDVGDEHEIAGVPFTELRRSARNEVVAAARTETEHLTGPAVEVPRDATDRPLIATGHQPAPFHPGVWIKNLATAAIAERVGGIGLNAIVDSDVRSSSSVRVPTGDAVSPRSESLPFDDEQSARPWEEADVVSSSTWDGFPSRLIERMAAWGIEPLAADPAFSQCSQGRLAERLSRTRGVVERRWGRGNLEVSTSRVCRTAAFRRFVLHVARDAERFRLVHNEILGEYRQSNRIRSSTHPVPPLVRRDDWTEAPFWIWREGDFERSPLLISRSRFGLRLGMKGEEIGSLPAADDAVAVDVLAALEAEGFRIRTRALTTTLFLRLFVGDLFVHGVGGAKYDEMTDELVRRFFGLPVPRFLLLSATKHLPIAADVPSPDELDQEIRKLKRRQRELRYQPERFFQSSNTTPEERVLVAKKEGLIAEQHAAESGDERLSRRERRARSAANHERYERIRAVNRELVQCVKHHAEATTRELAEAERRRSASAILHGREWAWWLYPEESLRPFLTDLEFD